MFTVILKSERRYGHRAPAGALGALLNELEVAVRQSIRMAFTGSSDLRGRQPEWLSKAADIRLLDYGGKDETLLRFSAPRLGKAAPELYEQQQSWPTRPDPSDTGFDLLGDIICGVARNDADSDKFDRPLLGRLRRFRKVLKGTFQQVAITGGRYTGKHPCILTESIIDTAKCLYSRTPPAQRVRVVGRLDMIRASTQTFALKLDTGEEVRGVLTAGDVAGLKNLFQQRVLVLGKAIFRPSGSLLRIDADEFAPASDDDRFFSVVPKPTHQNLDVRQVLTEQQRKRGLAAVFGKWPGDETDEVIAQALKELS